MASRVDICNLALLKLGSGSKITSLTDNSVAARALSNCYDLIRKAELRANTWSFSLKRTALPASATPPAWGYANAFPLPSDYVRLMQANQFYLTPALLDYNTGDASAFAIETNADGVLSILTDYTAPLKIRYVWDVTDEGRFDALFNISLAARLAYETCEQITNSNTKKQSIRQDYMDAIKQAVRTNSIEKPPALIGDDSWIVSRL